MILYIAEKPSLGRAIADVLPKPHKKQEGYIETGNGDIVSWCLGHLLEQADPESYDPQFKPWRFEHLPIIPQQWQLQPRSKTRKQLSVLRKLVKQSDHLVHAGDPDREGQLLVDEVINYLGASAAKKNATQRCLISDLNPPAVKRALNQLRSNSEFIPLSVSALARSRADWLYGINMTRAYTLRGRQAGYNGVLSVGRVQTPLLGLVVRRDQSIAGFVSKPFYEVVATLQTQAGDEFSARWKPSENCRPYQDEEGRVLVKKLADNVVQRITGKQGRVQSLQQKRKQQAAPLPFNLSALQIEAAKRFNLSAKQVLDICQTLYERHKLITYPRSDCRYLPEEHHRQGAQVVPVVLSNCSEFSKVAQQLDTQQRSAAWNDKKVSAHHAIIPTERRMDLAKLSATEQKVYQLIASFYLYQFLARYEYFETKVEVDIEGGLFISNAHQTLQLGWKQLLNTDASKTSQLPELKQGENLQCSAAQTEEKHTQPPKYFTDATLLAAMTGIARYVTDPDVRKVLKETDGLGTEATRAGIIELLFNRGFLYRDGRSVRASEVGIALISSLPDSATTPDMTARWESSLDGISQRQGSYEGFMQPLTGSLEQLIQQSQEVHIPETLRSLSKPVRRKRSTRKRSTKSTASGGSKRRKATAAS
ncbi:MAG: DNA topoisomerase III [Amphritea sp.]